MTSNSDSLLCPVKCMIFNEIANTIAETILSVTKKKPKQKTIGLHLENLQVTLFPDSEPPKCKEGWSLV